MTFRGSFQPLPCCDSVTCSAGLPSRCSSGWAALLVLSPSGLWAAGGRGRGGSSCLQPAADVELFHFQLHQLLRNCILFPPPIRGIISSCTILGSIHNPPICSDIQTKHHQILLVVLKAPETSNTLTELCPRNVDFQFLLKLPLP